MKKLNNKNNIIKFILYLLFITLINSNNVVFANNNNEHDNYHKLDQQFSELLKDNTYKEYNDGLIEQIKYLINNVYYYDVPESISNAKSVEEIMKDIRDPYTQYYTGEEFKKLQEGINNVFSGIGIYYKKHEDGIIITDMVPGSSAEYAGLKIGDIVIQLNREEIKGLSVEKIDKYIKGEEGTKVILDVKRGTQIVTFILQRRAVEIPTVDSKILDENIGYVHIKSFGNKTPELFKKRIENLLNSNIENLVVDLRGNLGGYTSSAYEIAGYFIGNKTVTIMKDKKGNETLYRGSSQELLRDIPIIFITDKNTASASEILTSAVKDYERAFIIGNKTYGKGVQQTSFILTDESFLKLTTHEFFSPFGSKINKIGVKPNFDTKSIDSLKVAELLFSGGKHREYNSQLVKLSIDSREFIIDLKKGKDRNYRSAFKYIIESSDGENIEIGNKDNWVKFDKNKISNDFYFENLKTMDSLTKSSKDTELTVKFNKDIRPRTANELNVKLVEGAFFQEVQLEYTIDKGNEIHIKCKEDLSTDKEYYLLVEGIESIDGMPLKNGSIARVYVY
ncbi:hypothetical protein DP145_08860 [Clostridium tetani]|uniref:S41 family peptidase n=1 Tax=Clostridium tetani TaxID=1513 RepID=UPI00100B7A26|nr:S41 family peptidase [Clostridium tetani]RXM66302.1 hypothetical protein DP145_08860 [Clostridium tetani]